MLANSVISIDVVLPLFLVAIIAFSCYCVRRTRAKMLSKDSTIKAQIAEIEKLNSLWMIDESSLVWQEKLSEGDSYVLIM